MLQYFLLVLQITALKTQFIPLSQGPPKERKGSSLIFHPTLNEIFVFGGSEKTENLFFDIWSYSLTSNIWKEYQPLSETKPSGRYACASFFHQDEIFIYGGNSNLGPLKDLWKFDPSTYTWSSISTINNPRTRFMSSYCDYYKDDKHFLAIYGGYIQGGLGPRLYILDLINFIWTFHGFGPFGSAAAGLVYYEDSLYLTGGLCNCTNLTAIPNTETHKYNLKNLSWQSLNTTKNYISRSLFGYTQWENYLYNFYGWSDTNYFLELSIMRLNLKTLIWEEILTNNYIQKTQYYGFAQANNSFYIFGGSDTKTVTNSLIKYSFSSSEFETIENIYLTPLSISNSCMVAMTNFIYLFGGMVGSIKLNDLWRYDVIENIWEKLKTYGEIPSPRSHAGAAAEGHTMIIWGGKDTYRYFNDAYKYNGLTKTWKLLLYNGSNSSPRYGVCVTISLPYVYIIGGDTVDGASSVLWEYDINQEKYTIIDSSTRFIQGFGHSCELRNENKQLFLYLVYGTGDGDTPLGYVYKYNFHSKFWVKIRDPGLSPDNRSRAVVKILGKKAYVFGGQTWATKAYSDVLEIGLDDGFVRKTDSLPVEVYLAGFTYLGSKVYIYGGGTVFEGTIRFLVPNHNFLYVDMFSLCDDDCKMICSPGTFQANGTVCNLCEPGSYSMNYGTDKCVLCPPGTYNNNYGSNTNRQCLPCDEGYFNSLYGQTHCRKCLESYVCPIGTIYPSESSLKDLVSSIQPPLYSRPTAQANKIALQVQMSFVSLGVLIIFIVICTPKIRKKVINFDIYSLSHNYNLNQPLYFKKTFFGSVFTIIFIVFAIIITSQAIVIYIKDNIFETKTLMPLVVLEKEVSRFLGNFTASVKLYNYGGMCIENDFCVDDISIKTTKINIGKSEIICVKEKYDCAIFYYCKNCEIKSDSKITFTLKEINSYTTAIKANLTSSSSIPSEISSIEIIKVASKNELFRGETPTKFYFTITPSYYKSQTDSATGYHIASEKFPKAGSSYTPSDLGFTSYLSIEFTLTKALNGLYTSRLPIQTQLVLLMAILGTVPGIMSINGSIMSFIESNYISYSIKRNKKHSMKQLVRNRKTASVSFKRNTIPVYSKTTENPIFTDVLGDITLNISYITSISK
ncbi:hypothetical protein SteCoe_24230 [Stentor coeruleus]|uniref:Tyrosine-protein kinase ephrin type A/B receptor-like domain-containing protein n=1 Tax=Stentor coeruleus TaxID=5963 RepID=A0A1R2BI15_9CILI|nr:hypothetical protein SteCoe_24230 [Stentor coeruleus]